MSVERARALVGDDVDLLTVKEYAARFGVHVQTVYSAIRYGHQLHGLAIRVTTRTIRIAVPRASIQGRISA